MEEGLKGVKTVKATPKIIVITGAESTGKSTLAKALSNHFNVPYVSEYAREYIQNMQREYTFKDVELIAKKQVQQYENAVNDCISVVVMDTWLIITKIWFQVVFNKIPAWIDEALKSKRVDLFLLCDTDLPWIDDDVRENGGNMRLQLQKMYVQEIKRLNGNWEIITGTSEKRVEKAISLVEKMK